MLEMLYRPLLILHVSCGTLALLASIIAFSASKWSTTHRYAGILFYWSMLITAASSVFPAITSGKWFLLLLAVFSFHLTYTGRRYLKFRQGGSIHLFDYLASGAILLFGLLIWALGIPVFYKNMGLLGGIAPLFFGLVCISMAREDYRWYQQKEKDDTLALKRHIGRMGGASISAFTAFFVNVNFVVSGALAWILPTVVGSFLIAYFIRKVNNRQAIR